MPTLNIGGRKVTVSDDFLKLSPEQQNSTVEEIAGSFAPAQEREPAAGNVPIGQSRSDDITASGLYRAADRSAADAAAGLGGLPKVVSDLGARGIQGAANWVSGKFGIEPDTRDLSKPGLIKLPTSQEVSDTIQRDLYGGADPYEPQNKWEDRARTGGEFLLNALGPGGPIRRIANVILPATATEAVKEAGGGELAQAGGALVGGMAASKLANATERMAAGKLPSLERGVAGSLPDAAQAEYKAITDAAVRIPTAPQHRYLIANSIENHLHQQNFRRANAPETYDILDDIRKGSKNPDVADLLTARRKLGNVRGEDGVAASQARDIVDGAIEAYMPGVGQRLATADQNWNAYKTAQMLGERFNKAELQAAGANSGLNLGNRIRQQATNVATNPRLTRYMKPEDRAALEALDRGTPLQNATRWTGNYLGGGGGLGALGASALLGHLGGGPLGAAAAVVGGLALKRGYNRSIAREAQRIADTIIARSPEAQRLGINYIPPMTIGQSIPGGARGGLLGFLGQ